MKIKKINLKVLDQGLNLRFDNLYGDRRLCFGYVKTKAETLDLRRLKPSILPSFKHLLFPSSPAGSMASKKPV
jgi:hypothetical protein